MTLANFKAKLVVEQFRTEKGGFLKKDTATWGVPWPLPKDWINQMILDPEGCPEYHPPAKDGP